MTAALAVGRDLLSRARLEAAAARAGVDVAFADDAAALTGALRDRPCELLILDLDTEGARGLEEIERARVEGIAPARVIGYFSHVNERLGDAARAAGCDALPRGRFWRELETLLAQPG